MDSEDKKQHVYATIEFLDRVDLKGFEVPKFTAVRSFLVDLLNEEPQPEPKPQQK